MKKFLIVLLMFVTSQVFSQDVTGNIVTGTFSNTTTTNTCGGTSGGTQAAYLGTTGIICWGYVQSTVAKTIAINQALSGSGVQIGGYNYSWNYYNSDYHRGTLSATIRLTGPSGQTLETYNYSMNDDTNSTWKTMSGTQDFTQQYSLANVGNLDVSFTGKDDRFWAGWYGPAIRNVNIGLKYTTAPIDPCVTDVLSSPSCPGYAQAYLTQQCSANPLYSVECPGYAAAYKTQQCSINPLYATDCPGYAQAYFDQQCSLNSLYNNQCPGYAAAYKTQQCSLNQLYATDCPGYADAYKTQQCNANPLYATDCPGYAQAYFAQQCEANGLYNQQCPNYSQAYAKKQLLDQQNVATTPTTNTTVTVTSTTNAVSITGTVQLVADTNVNNAITPPATTSTTSATSVSPASPVSVINSQPVAQNTVQQAAQPPAPTQTQVAAQQEQKQEQNKTEQKVANTVEKKMDSGAKGDRQKMRDAVAKVQKEIAKEAQQAKSIEAQVATQGLVVGSMNYVPGFDAYKNAIVPDVNALLMAKQYEKPVVDNQRAQRRLSGANESKWQQMVDSQYQIGK